MAVGKSTKGARARRRPFLGWGAVLGLLVAGCNAGQTGQNLASEGCDDPPKEIPADEEVYGVVPLDVAREIEGTYVSRLVWSDPSDESGSEVEDEVTVELAYEGGAAHVQCGRPSIEMTTSVTTRDSGIQEHGSVSFYTYPLFPDPMLVDGVLSIPSYSRAFGELDAPPVFVSMYAVKLPSRVVPHGSITILDGSSERYGHFPNTASVCLSEPSSNDAAYEPTADQTIDWLERISSENFTTEMPDLVVPALTIEAESGCDEGGNGRFPVTATLSSGSASHTLSGELLLLHRAEDPRVEIIDLHLSAGPYRPIDPAVLFPEGSACVPEEIQLTVRAQRSELEAEPFELVDARLWTTCKPR